MGTATLLNTIDQTIYRYLWKSVARQHGVPSLLLYALLRYVVEVSLLRAID